MYAPVSRYGAVSFSVYCTQKAQLIVEFAGTYDRQADPPVDGAALPSVK